MAGAAVAAKIMSATSARPPYNAHPIPFETFKLFSLLDSHTHSFIPPFLTMAPASLFHILSVVSLAVLHVSFGALPVNALALERNHAARGLGHAHADIAKRADSKKCRPRPTSVSPNAGAVVTSPVPSPQSSQPAPTTTSSQSPPANTPSSSGGDGSKIIYGWSNHEETSLQHFVPTGSKGRTCVPGHPYRCFLTNFA